MISFISFRYYLQNFACLQQSHVNDFLKLSTSSQHMDFMEKHTIPVKTLLVPMMPQNSTMRIKVVSHAEYDKLSTLAHLESVRHGNNQYLFGVEPFKAVDTAGIQVSLLVPVEPPHGTKDFICTSKKALLKFMVNGYGSRCLTKCIGFNAYRGQRHSKRPHPSPFTDPGQIGEHQYFTDSMKLHLKQPFTENFYLH